MDEETDWGKKDNLVKDESKERATKDDNKEVINEEEEEENYDELAEEEIALKLANEIDIVEDELESVKNEINIDREITKITIPKGKEQVLFYIYFQCHVDTFIRV